MSISVFLSTVTDEFGAYRVKLEGDLTRHDVAVKVQERFKDLGGDTLDKLDIYVAHCDAVVHLVGEMCGAAADAGQQEALVAKYPDLPRRLPPLGGALADGAAIPYTQWEAWLALYHKKPLMIAKAATDAPRGPRHAPTDGSRASQAAHLARLKAVHRYPGCEFQNPDDLAKHIAYSAILDLLVKDYAEKTARERDIAEGFIREMAKRVAERQSARFRRHETGGRERRRDLRKGDRRTAGGDQSRRHCRPRFGEGEGTGRQGSVRARPRHLAQGGRRDEAR